MPHTKAQADTRRDQVALAVLIAVALAHLCVCAVLVKALFADKEPPGPSPVLLLEGAEIICTPLP